MGDILESAALIIIGIVAAIGFVCFLGTPLTRAEGVASLSEYTHALYYGTGYSYEISGDVVVAENDGGRTRVVITCDKPMPRGRYTFESDLESDYLHVRDFQGQHVVVDVDGQGIISSFPKEESGTAKAAGAACA